ncbi:MAG: hypothetical protein WC869_00575 [Phycisphaerae bacterium]
MSSYPCLRHVRFFATESSNPKECMMRFIRDIVGDAPSVIAGGGKPIMAMDPVEPELFVFDEVMAKAVDARLRLEHYSFAYLDAKLARPLNAAVVDEIIKRMATEEAARNRPAPTWEQVKPSLN